MVENLCDRKINNPEGTGFDLRLGEVYELREGEGFLDVEKRNTPKSELVAKYNPQKAEEENYFIFKPGEYYLIKTIEKGKFTSCFIRNYFSAKYFIPFRLIVLVN